jgi:hypothetical protein
LGFVIWGFAAFSGCGLNKIKFIENNIGLRNLI